MVDALIAASQAKPSDNGPHMPGFGRDLVPFFDTDGNENTYGLASGTPPQGPEFTYEYQQPVMAQQNVNGGVRSPRRSLLSPAGAEEGARAQGGAPERAATPSAPRQRPAQG